MPSRRSNRRPRAPVWDPVALGAQCDRCPLRARRNGMPVQGVGPAKPRLAIVGEAPGPDEVKAGIPFIGRSGDLLEELFAEVGLYRSEVYIDNALACMPPGMDLDLFLRNMKRESKEDGLDYVDPIACCRPRLIRALGVPRCLKCDLFELGPERCTCKEPRWSPWAHRALPKCVVPMGNAALLSLIGVAGITKRRGAPWEARHGEAQR